MMSSYFRICRSYFKTPILKISSNINNCLKLPGVSFFKPIVESNLMIPFTLRKFLEQYYFLYLPNYFYFETF